MPWNAMPSPKCVDCGRECDGEHGYWHVCRLTGGKPSELCTRCFLERAGRFDAGLPMNPIGCHLAHKSEEEVPS
jgi:hypothetical protein